MSRIPERGEGWWTVDRAFSCEQCGKTKNGYPLRDQVNNLGVSTLCAPPLGWTMKDDPVRTFCSIQGVDAYDTKQGSSDE
jgi:hypothetical protein